MEYERDIKSGLIDGLVYGLLREGENNGITQREIENIIEIEQREVRRSIATLRESGKVILASNAGYYLPTNDDKGAAAVRKFIVMMELQAKSRFLSVRSASRWLEEYRQEML